MAIKLRVAISPVTFDRKTDRNSQNLEKKAVVRFEPISIDFTTNTPRSSNRRDVNGNNDISKGKPHVPSRDGGGCWGDFSVISSVRHAIVRTLFFAICADPPMISIHAFAPHSFSLTHFTFVHSYRVSFTAKFAAPPALPQSLRALQAPAPTGTPARDVATVFDADGRVSDGQL